MRWAWRVQSYLNQIWEVDVQMCLTFHGLSSPKFVFTPTFILCSPICPNNSGVVFCEKIFQFSRNCVFFVRPLNMQISTANITRVV